MMPTTTIATTISISVMPCWRALGSIGGIAQSIAIERYRGSRGHVPRRDGYSQPVGQGDARDRVGAGDLGNRDVQPVVGELGNGRIRCRGDDGVGAHGGARPHAESLVVVDVVEARVAVAGLTFRTEAFH